ncbi:methyltransferase domain-containing protein [Thermodesulfobacteriota bacterium]
MNHQEIPFQCPRCSSSIDWQAGHCSSCSGQVKLKDGIINFIMSGTISDQEKSEIKLHATLAPEYGKRYDHEFSRIYSDYWNKQFLDFLPTGCDMVLDCGCGTGDLTRSLLARSRKVVGMDISQDMILQGKKLFRRWHEITWVSCPGETLPFADNIFDAVCFRGALHHMAHEEKALGEAHRVLKPGGRLLLSEPNDDSLLLRLPRMIVNRKMARFGNDHKAFRSVPWLNSISAAGFTVLYTKYFSYLSQPLCGMSDLLPIMKYLPMSGSIAKGLVAFDELCSRLPLMRSQSFDLFVCAEKKAGRPVQEPAD